MISDGNFNSHRKKKNIKPGLGQASVAHPAILATQEAEIRGSGFKTSPGKQFVRPYLEKNNHKKELVEWLNGRSVFYLLSSASA
jgi:hypothetical protein